MCHRLRQQPIVNNYKQTSVTVLPGDSKTCNTTPPPQNCQIGQNNGGNQSCNHQLGNGFGGKCGSTGGCGSSQNGCHNHGNNSNGGGGLEQIIGKLLGAFGGGNGGGGGNNFFGGGGGNGGGMGQVMQWLQSILGGGGNCNQNHNHNHGNNDFGNNGFSFR